MLKNKAFLFARNALIVFAILFTMVWVRTYFSGRAQYLEGEAALKQGDFKNAITAYETAIHMYTPFSGYVPKSAERLWEIGLSFEKDGDYDWSLIALRSLRSSFYAVRSFYTPYKSWIERSEAEIDKVLELQRQAEQKKHPEAVPPTHE